MLSTAFGVFGPESPDGTPQTADRGSAVCLPRLSERLSVTNRDGLNGESAAADLMNEPVWGVVGQAGLYWRFPWKL